MVTLLTILLWMAWAGGIMLVFQLGGLLFGFDSMETDVDIDMDIDADSDVGNGGGVRLFSILGLSAFLFMFGLAGRYFILTVLLHWSIALIIALAIGVGMMWLIGYIFYKAKSLESNGVTKIADSVNCTGTVYLPFTGLSSGVVHINVNGIMREYNAVASNEADNFNVGESVKVETLQGNFLKVIKNNS